MDVFLLILRLILAAVFATASFGKLFDRLGAEKAFTDFGVPGYFRKPLSLLLPIAEIAVSVSFLFVTSSWFGSIGAGLLLTIFLGGMLYQIAKGNAPDCHCFGQLHSEPVGFASVARNLVLLAIAGFLIGQGPARQGQILVNSSQELLILLMGSVSIALLGAIALLLKRVSNQQVELIRRVEVLDLTREGAAPVERDGVVHPHEGLPIGAKFPDFELQGVNGDRVTLDALKGTNKPSLFFFISPSCTPCRSLVPEFEQWQIEFKDAINFVFVTSGTREANIQKFGENVLGQLLIQKNRELADLTRAKWTPTTIFVDRRGRVASQAAAGDSAIRELVEKIRSEDLENENLYFTSENGIGQKRMIGAEVPDFSLQDVDGKTLSSNQLLGKTTLVTFWGLDCGHCEQMLDELRKWDTTRTNGDPELLVITDGDLESNAALRFRSRTVIDPGYKVSEKLGMFGTPSAILVDENGIIISETAMGAADIWALIGRYKLGSN